MLVAGDANTVGETAAGARNVVSGNDEQGIYIQGTGVTGSATENRIEGNYIGTTADGTADLGNTQNGVSILGGPDLTAVGGTTPGSCQPHRQQRRPRGPHISHSNSTGNHILSNRIYNNGGLGIDLAGGTEDASGVTANDTSDPDSGPNNLQNFPVITSATRSTSTNLTTISGRLNSNPSQDFVIQCFLTNRAPASAHGEGLRLLDTTVASTNANGNTRFSCVSTFPLLGQVPGQTVSATATNIITGDSSEFSKNRAITSGP